MLNYHQPNEPSRTHGVTPHPMVDGTDGIHHAFRPTWRGAGLISEVPPLGLLIRSFGCSFIRFLLFYLHLILNTNEGHGVKTPGPQRRCQTPPGMPWWQGTWASTNGGDVRRGCA